MTPRQKTYYAVVPRALAGVLVLGACGKSHETRQASDAVAWMKNQVTNMDDRGVLSDLEESNTAGNDLGEDSAKSDKGPRRT